MSTAVLAILNGSPIPEGMNHTYVALIPKKHKPIDVSDFRPISLCNVIYKLVTKVITNRLKELLPVIISENQCAFTPGRLITNNILVAFEVFHSMNCYSGSNGSMAIKLDIAKPYDKVEWNFLRRVMLKLDFKPNWVDLVMHCVETTSFSFLTNGAPCGYVKPSRGLRQGDPISPYLFFFCAEGLSYLIADVVAKSRLMGHRICRDAA